MRFKAHFIRRKSAPFIPPISSSRKGSVCVSIYADPVQRLRQSVMSGRDSTISNSDVSLGLRSGRDSGSTKYVRRPNLAQILADEAPAPWTLEDFTAYAARNLCLENIEFIQDARKYRAAYRTIMGSLEGEPGSEVARPVLKRLSSAQVEKLKELWTRLIVDYIAPSSPKEINLTGDIRAGLLPHNKQSTPPSPMLLNPAIKKIEELIEDSILFSFLNEVQSSANHSAYQPSVDSRERLAIETGFQPTDKSGNFAGVQETLSPMSDVPAASPFSPARPSPRSSHHFAFPHSTRPSSHKGSTASASTSAPFTGSAAASLAPTLSEDNSSMISPVASQKDQRSPPRTPPSNESETRRSPKQHDRWKRMSQRFGFSKKSGSALKDVQEDQPPIP